MLTKPMPETTKVNSSSMRPSLFTKTDLDYLHLAIRAAMATAMSERFGSSSPGPHRTARELGAAALGWAHSDGGTKALTPAAQPIDPGSGGDELVSTADPAAQSRRKAK
jgi:hypothetical protein